MECLNGFLARKYICMQIFRMILLIPYHCAHIALFQVYTMFWHSGWHSSSYFHCCQFELRLEWTLLYLWVSKGFCLQWSNNFCWFWWGGEVLPTCRSSDCPRQMSWCRVWGRLCMMDPRWTLWPGDCFGWPMFHQLKLNTFNISLLMFSGHRCPYLFQFQAQDGLGGRSHLK